MQKHAGFHFVHAHELGVMFYGAQQGDFTRALAEFTTNSANSVCVPQCASANFAQQNFAQQDR